MIVQYHCEKNENKVLGMEFEGEPFLKRVSLNNNSNSCKIQKRHKNSGTAERLCRRLTKSSLVHLCETFAAIYCSAFLGFKGNLSLSTAGSASCGIHNTLSSAGIFPCVAASLASLRFVNETFLSIKFLFACCENEFVSAFLAD